MTAAPRSLPLVALVLAAVVLVINIPLIAGGKTWADIRYHTQVAPPRLAAAEAVQSGALPTWWEGSGLGVPLAAEPSHGALYPPIWIASSTRALDLVAIVHLLWAAIGIALWARRRGASEPAIVVVSVLAIASGLFASLAVRGALPAIAHLPWLGVAASWLAEAKDRRTRVQAMTALAVLLGCIGLTGVLAVLFDGLVIAAAICANKQTRGYLAGAIVAGLAISCVQWVPALLASGAGDVVHGLSPSRFLELVVPGSFGSSDSDRAVAALAGEHAWAPSLFVGAGLFALAAVRTPARRMLVAIGVLVVLALVAGRGGWPAWLGAPELHVAALVVVLAANAANGLDDLLEGRRRALLAMLAGLGCTAIALAAVGIKHATASDAISRALVDGGISLACLGIAIVLAWRSIALPAIYVMLLLSSVSAVPSTAPTIERAVVDEPQAFATAAMKLRGKAPVRVFRPVYMTSDGPQTLDDAIATFAGASPARFGLVAARSEDPARLAVHDRTWLKAANEGGALLDRFGIELAILPQTLVASSKLDAIATRGSWALVKLPVAPPAAVSYGALWSSDVENTLDLLYPISGGTGVLRGSVVLDGTGTPQHDRGAPRPCTIARWEPGAIDVTCTADAPAYATISSTTSAGWSVTVDDRETPWHTADVLRRAVKLEPGTHQIAWRYMTPGLVIGLLLAAFACLGLAIAAVRARV